MNLASKNHAIHFQGLIMIIQLEKKKKKKTGYRHGEAYKSLCPEKGGKDRLKNHSTHQQKNELTNNKMKMKKRRKKRTTIQGTKGLTRQQPSISI